MIFETHRTPGKALTFARTSRASSAGFTLMEILLAATLSALIFGVAASVIASVVGGTSRVNASISQDNLGGEIEDIIADDLAFLTAFTDRPCFTATVDSGNVSSLSFYTSAGAKTAWGTVVTPIHLVTYQVKTMPTGGKGLFRGEKPLVETRGAVYDAPLLVSDNVTLFKVEAYDGLKWQTAWPEEGGAPLPNLIRVYIDVQDSSGGTQELYVESSPPTEYAVRPQTERRASGGGGPTPGGPTAGQGANSAEGANTGAATGDQGNANAPAPEGTQ